MRNSLVSVKQSSMAAKSLGRTGPSRSVTRYSFAAPRNSPADRTIRGAPPAPPPPPAMRAKDQPWFKPTRRDFLTAGLGSIIGGGVMFLYDTLVIDELYTQIEDLEDDLVYTAEVERELIEAGGLQNPYGWDEGRTPTMEELEKK